MNNPAWTNVWDPLVRVFHWTLALAVGVAWLTEDNVLIVHLWAGYTVLGLLAVRVAWGFVGSHHARFADFVRRPSVVLAYLWDIASFRAPRHLGHNPAGGAMVVALLACLALTGFSGVALYGALEFSGPLAGLTAELTAGHTAVLKQAHELLVNLTLALVAIHLAGVLAASLQHRENLVRSMITGRKAVHVPTQQAASPAQPSQEVLS